MSKNVLKSLNRSNAGHQNSIKRINNIKASKAGFYEKGEWEDLEKRRMYHIGVYQRQRFYKRILTKDEKSDIWNNINVNGY